MDVINNITKYPKTNLFMLVLLLFVAVCYVYFGTERSADTYRGKEILDPVVSISIVTTKMFSPVYTVKSVSCSSDSQCLKPESASPIVVGLSPVKKKIAEQIISLFENDTITPQYDYIENIGDGRGFTAGIAGFTSAYGEIYEVVRNYSTIAPTSSITKYLNNLRKLEKGELQTQDLEDFIGEWQKASYDRAFRSIQDTLRDTRFYNPAMSTAKNLGIKHNITKAFMYDTIIQHGNSPKDPDGLPMMIEAINKKLGGSPAKGVDEVVWLKELIRTRRSILEFPSNADTREAWSYSVDRCDFFDELLEQRNLDLVTPIHINTVNHNDMIP